MNCEYCQNELKEIAWNSQFDVAVCDNWKCSKFRQPVAKIIYKKEKRKKSKEFLSMRQERTF